MNKMAFQHIFVSGLLILLAFQPGFALSEPVDQNSAEVVYKFQLKLASRGHPDAQHKLGMLYETGRGVPLNVDFARQWYERAAAQDYKPAINRLVYLDISKNGFSDKHKTWLDNISQEAKEDDGEAQFLLGQMYARGLATEQNLDTAIVLLRKASGNNIPGAEDELLRVEKILSQRKQQELERQKLAEEKQKELAEKKAREQQQARLLAIEEQKKREARQKQIEREKLLKQQAEEQRKLIEAKKLAEQIAKSQQKEDKLDASDICSGSNRFLPTCR